MIAQKNRLAVPVGRMKKLSAHMILVLDPQMRKVL